MFSREQIDNLYYLVEKGVVSAEAVNLFLKSKLTEIGVVEPTPPEPEVPAETPPADAPPAPVEGQPAA